MKCLFPALVFLTLGYVGFVIWRNQHPPLVQESSIPVPEVAIAVATPTPIPVATVAPTPARNLAPPGTYFLLRRVSFMTDSGVVGDSPGTKVTMIKGGNPMKVTDGRNEFEVDQTQVTNDIDIATKVFYADQYMQAQIMKMTGQEAAAFAKQQEADEKEWQAKVHSLGSTYAQPLPMDDGALNQGPRPVVVPDSNGNYRGAIH